MRSRLVALAVIVALILAIGGTGTAAQPGRHDTTEQPAASGGASDYAIVLFRDPPAASYEGGIPGLARTKPERGRKLDVGSKEVAAYREHLGRGHGEFRQFLRDHAPGAEVVAEYFHVLNGVAVRLNGTPIGRLAGGPGVRAVVPSALYRPTMNISTGLISADEVWALGGGRAGAGEGVKVGIIDSGIDDTHPFFACKDGDGDGHADIPHKVYASGVAGFDPDQVIVNDHGTHVAGTVAGCVIELEEGPVTGTISGVAPAAALYDYNVFPGFGAGFVAFGGSAFSHDIIRALEDAVADGMDVINMSLGGTVQGPHDVLAEAVNAVVDAGVVVAVAAGNTGPGDATVESPGSAARALTVGATTNPHYIGIQVTVGEHTYGAALGDFKNFAETVTVEYTVTEPANGCSAISTDLTGKVALIDRGVCSFTTKIRNAEAAGAVGVLVVNNVPGDPTAMAHDGTEPFPAIPAAMVSQDDGNAMKPSGTVTIDPTASEIVTENADIIAGFSSRGPTPFTNLIKPDLTAPGVNVYSSVFEGQFAMFQGTSMATPHAAGAAALLLWRHPDWSPADVKSALVNTAARVVTDRPGAAAADPGVLARGGGRIDLAAAEPVPVTIDPVSASFGSWQGNRAIRARVDLTLRNVSGGPQTCTVDVRKAPGVPDQIQVTASADEVAFAGPGETATLTLTLEGGRGKSAPAGDHEGDAVLDCGGTTLRVPWWVRVAGN